MATQTPFTQAQYDALVNAIAEGVLTVKYGDKQVTYRSLAEMFQLRNVMATELGLNVQKVQRKYGEYSKGTNTNQQNY